mmetsp:Transcript_44915/g.80776  ORF Transcript_44915/g.80776 Transcript_44915/m.80776 type:complete len:228 (+) Transcript_44915:973-1656(+)
MLAEDLHQLSFVSPLFWHVLHVEVCERSVGGISIVTFHERAHFHGLFTNLHAIDSFDGLFARLLGFVLDESVAERVALSIRSDLAGQDVAEKAEGVIERLVVDVLVQVLDVDVAGSALAQAWVSLAPHDAARAALDAGVVQGVQGSFGIPYTVEVHIAVAQRLPGQVVTANADGGHGADGVEDLVEHSFGDIEVQVTDVEGGELRNTTGSHDSLKVILGRISFSRFL